jgi:hypothetical protein
MHPKVFVSHASEDKERFVIKFATKLRENGVDAWLDRWEMLPGDSLIDKIFEEGLKEAQAVILVLSNFSIEKPWVREELNASIVNKISKGTKIIPLVLDDCNVPEPLKSTLWEPIKDLNNYENSLKRILSSIFGVTDKPAIGAPPAYTSISYTEIGGLTKADNLILKDSCEWVIENTDRMIKPDSLFGDGSRLGLSREEIRDCIEMLNSQGYFKVSWYLGSSENSYSCHYRITVTGFDSFLKAYHPEYGEYFNNIVSLIVNEKTQSNYGIEEKLKLPLVIIDNFLELLELHGQLGLSKTIGGQIQIHHVAASLRRSLN